MVLPNVKEMLIDKEYDSFFCHLGLSLAYRSLNIPSFFMIELGIPILKMVDKIYDGMFWHDINITSLSIPKNISLKNKEIEQGSILNCSNLKTLYIEQDEFWLPPPWIYGTNPIRTLIYKNTPKPNKALQSIEEIYGIEIKFE